MSEPFQVFVAGKPATQGSKRFIGRSKNGRGIMIESSKSLPGWRADVRAACLDGQGRPKRVFDGPVTIDLHFLLPRPKRLPKKAGSIPITKPDGDKLERAIWDAVKSAGVIPDDALCSDWSGRKRYAAPGQTPGCWIKITETTE